MKRLISILLLLSLLSGCSISNDNEVKKIIIEDQENLKEDFMEIKIDSIAYKNSIEPSKPQGYHHVYEGKKDYTYLCIQGVIENKSDETLDVTNIETNLEISDKEYEGRIRIEKKDGSDFITQMKKKEKLSVLLFFMIPQKKLSEIKFIKLKLRYQDVVRKIQERDDDTYEVLWNLDVRNYASKMED